MYEIRDGDQETQGRRWDWIDPRQTMEMSEGGGAGFEGVDDWATFVGPQLTLWGTRGCGV